MIMSVQEGERVGLLVICYKQVDLLKRQLDAVVELVAQVEVLQVVDLHALGVLGALRDLGGRRQPRAVEVVEFLEVCRLLISFLAF